MLKITRNGSASVKAPKHSSIASTACPLKRRKFYVSA
nr:MAG TPA: hypothetical protein [Caudoviricetes sp.]